MITKEFLSGSVDGQTIGITQTSTPGDLIHTAHATSKDEVWLYIANTSAATRTITIEFGGTAASNLIEVQVDAKEGLTLALPGPILSNNLVVRVFADDAGVNVIGWVNRIE